MANQKIHTKMAPAALGAYSQAVVCGETIYLSGQLGIDPTTNTLPSSFIEQAQQALLNVEAILIAAGHTRNNIVKLTIFLADIKNFELLNNDLDAFFEGDFPARSLIEASALPKNALIEIDAIAAI